MKRKRVLSVSALMVVIFLAWGVCYNPPSREARESARRAACASRLKSLHRALQEYRSEHDGGYPKSLDDLYPSYIPGPKGLTCVATKRKFIYLGAQGPLGDDSMLAYDHPDNHNKAYGDTIKPCVIVLLNNGQVVRMSPEDFRLRLRRQLSAEPHLSSDGDATQP